MWFPFDPKPRYRNGCDFDVVDVSNLYPQGAKKKRFDTIIFPLHTPPRYIPVAKQPLWVQIMNGSGRRYTSSTFSTHVRDNLVPVRWLALLKYYFARAPRGYIGKWTDSEEEPGN